MWCHPCESEHDLRSSIEGTTLVVEKNSKTLLCFVPSSFPPRETKVSLLKNGPYWNFRFRSACTVEEKTHVWRWALIRASTVQRRTYLNKDMIVAVVIAFKQFQINPKKKIRDFNGIRTHGLWVKQLSYEDPYIGSTPICWVNLNPWFPQFTTSFYKKQTYLNK